MSSVLGRLGPAFPTPPSRAMDSHFCGRPWQDGGYTHEQNRDPVLTTALPSGHPPAALWKLRGGLAPGFQHMLPGRHTGLYQHLIYSFSWLAFQCLPELVTLGPSRC